MNKYILGFFLIICLSITNSFAASFKSDEINVFLIEYKDGEKTGNFIHFHLFISKDWTGLVKWNGTQESYEIDEYQKVTAVDSSEIILDADPVAPTEWIPGKLLRCKYEAWGGESVNLVAKKTIKGNRYDWNVVADGTFQMTKAMPVQKWHFEAVKEINLKYPNLKLLNIYYDQQAK
jgi:hypothetical protein